MTLNCVKNKINHFSSGLPTIFSYSPPLIFTQSSDMFPTMSRNVAKVFRTMLHTTSPSHRLKANIFERIPAEIIERILESLPDGDQICFSLSCKYTFACFHSYVKQHGAHIAQILPLRKRPMLRGNSARTTRTNLLLRLQNNRWRYCSQCWSPHRYSVWRALQSNWKLYQKPCNSACDLAGTRSLKCSSLYAGEVDICPCNAMTFH